MPVASTSRRPAVVGSTLAAAASILVRFRRALGAERAQIQWFTVAAAQLVAAFAALVLARRR